ncbi:MAG: sulfatase-like hydrolase/transferase, partial [Planctomycetota bacterium]|nr:sulfatase-like hydrolase/transferase [Planctomycetota bacterium]
YSRDNRPGMIADGFDLEEVDLVFLKKSQEFLRNHVKHRRDQPFFLFHSAQAVHLPSFPADSFKGKTKSGPHGDFIFELDHVVGELLKTLKELEVAENTLVIFSSDNGPETTSVVHMRKDHEHDGAHPWRGMKRDNWEGGHRVPLIASWPAKIKGGATCGQTTCLTDIMATCAGIVGFDLPNDAAEDSYDLSPALLDPGLKQPIRPYTIHQTISLALAIRKGPWKLLDHQGSGGNRYDRGLLKPFALPNREPDAPGQLFNLVKDPGEKTNVYSEYPAVVEELKSKLEHFKKSGRSAPVR